MKIKNNKKILLIFLFFSFFILYMIGTLLTQSAPSIIGVIPKEIKNAKSVSILSKSGSTLKGWILESKQEKGGVLLLHGVRSNRLQMLNRAKFLQEAGYTVLLFDFQAHGESTGKKITFGHLESLDVEAAYAYLEKKLTYSNIAIIGISLGGASALFSSVKTKVKVMVLEAVYPSIVEAIANRLNIYLGSMGHYLSFLLTMQLEPRLGVSIDELRPIDQISKVRGAVLVIAGEKDEHTTLAESKKLFEKANEPKELFVVKGAKHIGFDSFLGKVYENKILAFLDEYMK